jgi:valyl-tRNA synthetase
VDTARSGRENERNSRATRRKWIAELRKWTAEHRKRDRRHLDNMGFEEDWAGSHTLQRGKLTGQ